jgi:hypothetical protein
MRSLVWKLALAALTLALVAAPVLRASAAWAAAPALEEAQKLYDGAQFNEAIAKIRDALSTGQLTGNDAIAARALQARCQVKTGNRLEAKEGFKFVLRQQPGYKLDPNTAGPDEQEVFQLAQRELTAEQIEAGKRIPASIAFNVGWGSGENKDMGEMAAQLDAHDTYDVQTQFGGAVRFPLSPKLLLEVEMQRFRATNEDTLPPGSGDSKFEITALPISLSLYYTAYTMHWLRFNVFAGGGILATATSSITLDLGNIPVTISGQKTGAYFHGGLEGEVLLHPRFTLSGRVMGRSAKVNDVMSELSFNPDLFADREIDFSGFAATIGLRAYIGY